MMLDIVAEDFRPYQRKLEDALGIQFEILQALERAQLEMNNAASLNESRCYLEYY